MPEILTRYVIYIYLHRKPVCWMGDNFFPPRRDFCYLLVIFGLYVFVIHGRQFSGNIFLFLNP